ncbi:hypothetical protein WJX82_004006 [Trebouxia sp. C0006]
MLSQHLWSPDTPAAGLSGQLRVHLTRPRISLPRRQSAFKPVASTRRDLLVGSCGNVCACTTRIKSGRWHWYDRYFAYSMAYGMQDYEEQIAGFKTGLFADLFTCQIHSMLEVGMGTGPNLKYLAAQKSVSIVGVDPNPEMAPYAIEAASRAGLTRDQLQMLDGTAEQLPVASQSQDAVICTLVLCSVPNVESALAEVKRVLKPGGKFLFIEHVLAPAPDRKLRLFQHILNPLQQATADSCHLDRDTLKSIQSAGFANVDASSFVVPGLGLIGPHIAGIATVK